MPAQGCRCTSRGRKEACALRAASTKPPAGAPRGGLPSFSPSMRLLLLSLLALCFPGCAGYQLGPVKPKLMADVRSIAVASFKNDTLEPRVEVMLANAVIKQIQQDGTYRVADEKSADAIL